MYLISGTLFSIASLFLFVINNIVQDLYYNQSNPFITLFAFISLLAGIIFYVLNYYDKKRS